MRRSYLNGTNQKIPKHIEFIRKFPTYVSNGKITFPILDEYLLVFNGIFGDNYRKKPIPIYDSFIPQQYFPDILQIWDVYHNLSKLIERIRHYAPPDLGGFSHFNETKIHLSNFTREDIYKALRFGPHNENS